MHLTFCLLAVLLASFGNAVNGEVDSSKYTVAFHFEGLGYRCLGGIINDHFVVTVGQCFADKWGKHIEVPKITAIAGANDLSNVEGSVKSQVAAVILPYFYASRSRHIHDFAIVKLKESLNLQQNGLVALSFPAPSYENNFAKVGTVGGYGLNEKEPGQLKYEHVDVVEYGDCFQGLAHDDFARHVQFCVKRTEEDCLSDRGSPYVDNGVLVGVQMECDEESQYELYKKVSGYSQLIPSAIEGKPGPYSTHYYS